jgi:hypothetical protein
MLKPDEVPSSSMAGGIRFITMPSGVRHRRLGQATLGGGGAVALVPVLHVGEDDGRVGAGPEKLKPSTDWVEAMPGRVAAWASKVLTTSRVRSVVASEGSWMEVMK